MSTSSIPFRVYVLIISERSFHRHCFIRYLALRCQRRHCSDSQRMQPTCLAPTPAFATIWRRAARALEYSQTNTRGRPSLAKRDGTPSIRPMPPRHRHRRRSEKRAPRATSPTRITHDPLLGLIPFLCGRETESEHLWPLYRCNGDNTPLSVEKLVVIPPQTVQLVASGRRQSIHLARSPHTAK